VAPRLETAQNHGVDSGFDHYLRVQHFMFSVPPITTRPTDSNDRMSLRNARIVCDGNSITQGAQRPEHSYPQQLENLLNERQYGVKVINLGVSSQTTTHMLNDAVLQVDRRYDPTRLNLLIAMEGGNHIVFGATPQAAYETFAQYCIARRDMGYHVVAIDTWPRNNGYAPGNDRAKEYAADLLEYNRLIRTHWPEFADRHFDARLELPEFDMRPPYMDDGIHPSIAGNVRLAAKLGEFLIAHWGDAR
jgi:lysophospholipase L1-like esterase